MTTATTSSAGAPRPPWADLTVDRPADARSVAAAVLAGVAVDVAVRAGVTGLGGALAVVVATAVLLCDRDRVRTTDARVVLALAPVFGLWLAVRASPWLLVPDVLVAGGLLVLGASLAGGGRLVELTLPRLALRAASAAGHGLAALPFLWSPLSRRLRRRAATPATATLGAVARGVLLAAPLLVVLGVLLASADAVFAAFFSFDVDAAPVVAHVAVAGAGLWAMGGLLRVASSPAPAMPALAGPRLGAVEATVVLGSLVALFASFAAAQAWAASEGGRHVIDTAGLTYAEYARSGFFQLVWVAGLTLATLLALRATVDLADPGTGRRLRLLAVAAVALTLVVVGVALRRLWLYQEAYGLTMLRLFAAAFVVWVAVVFVLLGAWLAGAAVAGRRSWLLAASAAAGLATLLALNAADPEALVVRHNVARAGRAGPLDVAYLSRLSDDAVPALLADLPRLAPDEQAAVLDRLECGRDPGPFRGWAAYNLARARALQALARRCG